MPKSESDLPEPIWPFLWRLGSWRRHLDLLASIGVMAAGGTILAAATGKRWDGVAKYGTFPGAMAGALAAYTIWFIRNSVASGRAVRSLTGACWLVAAIGSAMTAAARPGFLWPAAEPD